MRRLRVLTATVGRVAREVWQRALQVYAAVRGRRGPGAAASSIRRQYVFGGIGRKTFDRAIRRRPKRGR